MLTAIYINGFDTVMQPALADKQDMDLINERLDVLNNRRGPYKR